MENNRIIAIGDIHGCANTLRSLLLKVKADPQKDNIVFLGDYIDRGAYPLEVINIIQRLALSNPNNVISLKGNHEDMCYRYYRERNVIWTSNGYIPTKLKIDCLPGPEIEDLLNWMNELPLLTEIQGYKFSHSGFYGLEQFVYCERKYYKCLWDRNWIENAANLAKGSISDVFGHTPSEKPLKINNSIGIDTGCCYGGCLTAAIIENEEINTVSVPADEKDIILRK